MRRQLTSRLIAKIDLVEVLASLKPLVCTTTSRDVQSIFEKSDSWTLHRSCKDSYGDSVGGRLGMFLAGFFCPIVLRASASDRYHATAQLPG